MFRRPATIKDRHRYQVPCSTYRAYIMLQRSALYRTPDATYLFRYSGAPFNYEDKESKARKEKIGPNSSIGTKFDRITDFLRFKLLST